MNKTVLFLLAFVMISGPLVSKAADDITEGKINAVQLNSIDNNIEFMEHLQDEADRKGIEHGVGDIGKLLTDSAILRDSLQRTNESAKDIDSVAKAVLEATQLACQIAQVQDCGN